MIALIIAWRKCIIDRERDGRFRRALNELGMRRERGLQRPTNEFTIKDINFYFPVQKFDSIPHTYNQTK